MIKTIGDISIIQETKTRIQFNFNYMTIFAIDNFLYDGNNQLHRWVYSAAPPGFDYEIDQHKYKCKIIGVDLIESC